MEELLLLHDPHLCIITETWLHVLIRDDEIVPPGYQLFRRDRGSRGGGVAVVVKHGIEITVTEQIGEHESLILRVSFRGITFFLCAVYRPPDTSDDFLNKLYDHLLKLSGRNLIVTGDFNLPSINWNSLQYGCSTSSDILVDIMYSLNLEQMVKNCTRGNAILDLLFVTEMFSSGSVLVEPGISDHKLISFNWTKQAVENKKTFLRL